MGEDNRTYVERTLNVRRNVARSIVLKVKVSFGVTMKLERGDRWAFCGGKIEVTRRRRC